MTLFLYADGSELDMPARDLEFRHEVALIDDDTLERHVFSRTALVHRGRITSVFVESGTWRGAAFAIRLEKALDKKYPRKPAPPPEAKPYFWENPPPKLG